MKTAFELVRLMAMSFQKIESIMELVMIPVEVTEISCFNLSGSGFLFCEPTDDGFDFTFLESEGVSLVKVAGFRREPIADIGSILIEHPFLDGPLEADLEEMQEPAHFHILLEIEAIARKMPSTCLTFLKSASTSGAGRLIVFATNENESSLTSFGSSGETKYIHDLCTEQHEHVLQMFREMKFDNTANNT